MWLAIGFRFRLNLFMVQVSGIGYVLSGPIFYQIYNPPFLIGATWLPVAMAGVLWIVFGDAINVDVYRTDRSRIFTSDVWILTGSLVMMVLGGDAQAAYHVVLIATCICMATFFNRGMLRLSDPGKKGPATIEENLWKRSFIPFVKIGCAAILAVSICAIQIIPTLYWIRQSERWSSNITWFRGSASKPTVPQAPPAGLSMIQESRQSGQEAEPRMQCVPRREPGNEKTSRLELSVSLALLAPVLRGEGLGVRGRVAWNNSPLPPQARPVESASSMPLIRQPAEFSEQPWHLATLIAPNVFGSYTPVHSRWAQVISNDGRIWTPSLHVGLLVLVLAIVQWRLNWSSAMSQATFWVALIALLSSFGPWGLYDLWDRCMPGYRFFRYPAKWTTMFAWAICMSACLNGMRWHRPVAYCSIDDDRDEASLAKRSVSMLGRFFGFVGMLGIVVVAVHLTIVWWPMATQWTYAVLANVPDDTWCGPLDAVAAIRNLGWSGLILVFVGFLSALTFTKGANVDGRKNILWNHVLAAALVCELTFAAASQMSFADRDWLSPAKILAKYDVEAKENHSELAEWSFGDFKQPVVLATFDSQHSLSFSENSRSGQERLVAKQAAAYLGKLHLLDGVRNFQAQFTFRPQIIADRIRGAGDSYWSHHLYRVVGNTKNAFDAIEFQTDSNSSIENEAVEFHHVEMQGSRIAFNYHTELPVVLELPVFNDGGWQVQSPKISAMAIVPSRSKMLLISLPAGEHRVQIEYWPPGLSIGILISFASLTIVFVCQTKHRLRFLCWCIPRRCRL